MNILIAGGAGFVGTNLIQSWVKKYPKHTFLVLDNLQGGNSLFKEGFQSQRVTFENIDVRNRKAVEDIVTSFHPDVIINAIDASRDPDFLDIHIAAAAVLLDLAKSMGVEQYIHISCGEVYGTGELLKDLPAQRLLNEDDSLFPASPQQASNAAADLLTWSYFQRYNLPGTILRSTYLYGPYQSVQRLIPLIITRAIQNQTFPIPGNNNDQRDLMHIDDLITALESIWGNQAAFGQIYNVSAGVRMRITEIAETILTVLDRSKNLMQIEDEPVVRFNNGLDATKIKNQLDWKAKKSHDVQRALEETVQWYKDNEQWWKGEAK